MSESSFVAAVRNIY